MPYQTFDPDKPGDSDSAAKLAAIQLDLIDLAGATVLDIGCNAGYFCEAAELAGAGLVIGIDQNAELINEAKQRAAQHGTGVCRYHCQSWDTGLPAIGADVILMLSAFHYVSDPLELLREIADTLTADGVFVLECGIAEQPGETWQRCTRTGNSTVRYPSMSMMHRLLSEAGLSFRYIGPSVDQRGDPIPRHVFHCRKRSRSMLIVSGPGRVGKSTLCRSLSGAVVNVDDLTIANVETERTPWTEHAREIGIDYRHLQTVYQSLSERPPLLAGFVDSIMDCLPHDETVIVDCHELLTDALQQRAITDGFRVWTARKQDG